MRRLICCDYVSVKRGPQSADPIRRMSKDDNSLRKALPVESLTAVIAKALVFTLHG